MLWAGDNKDAVLAHLAQLAMVSLGCGFGVVPQLVLEKSPLRERVRFFQVELILTPFTTGSCSLEKHLINPAIQAFCNCSAEIEQGEVKKKPIPA